MAAAVQPDRAEGFTHMIEKPLRGEPLVGFETPIKTPGGADGLRLTGTAPDRRKH